MEVRETRWWVLPFLAGGLWTNGVGKENALWIAGYGDSEASFIAGEEEREVEEAEEEVFEVEEPILSWT